MTTTLGMCVLLMAMLVSMGNWDKKLRRSYRCPQCGTQRQDKHSEDCAWKGGS